MKNATSSLFVSLHSTASLPAEIHLVPAGTFKGADGRGPFRVENPDALIAASMAAGKLPIDECHATDFAAPKGMPAPARGWVVEMFSRENGIWGRVEWNTSGRALMEDHAYRGISPVFMHMKDGTVTQVLRASLTNDPNLTQLKTLHAKEPQMDLMSKLRTLLQLDADADDAAVTAALDALSQKVSAQSRNAEEITSLLGGAETSVVETIKALQAKAATADEAVAKVSELTAEVDQLKITHARAEAERAVDAAITAGKPVKPMREHYIARHMKEPEAVGRELAALPSINSGGIDPSRAPSEVVGEAASQAEIEAAAKSYQHKMAGEGHTVSWIEAVMHVSGRN